MIGSQVDLATAACALTWGLLSPAASIATSSASTLGIASPIILRGSLSRLRFAGKRCGLCRSLRRTICRLTWVGLCLHHHCGPAIVTLSLAISFPLLFGLLSPLIVSWPFGCLWSRSFRLFLNGCRIIVLRFFGGLGSPLVLILILWARTRTFCLLLACCLLLGSLVVGLLFLIIRLLLLVLLLATSWVVILHTCLVGYDDRFRCLLWFTF